MNTAGEVIVFGLDRRLTIAEQDRVLDRVNHLHWVESAERLYPEGGTTEIKRHCIARINPRITTTEEATTIIEEMEGVDYAERPARRQM